MCNCCNSILAQTYRNIELILVNDGSEDNSLAICKEIQASDKRVVVIDKENGGCYSAWNKGLDVATGDLIGFVDNDDYIQPQMYETLLDILIEQDADICALLCIKEFDTSSIRSGMRYLKSKSAFSSIPGFNNTIIVCIFLPSKFLFVIIILPYRYE